MRIDDATLEQARMKTREFLISGGQHKIFTPNPEMLVRAQRDKYFHEVLNSGDLNLCDGFGVWLVMKMTELDSGNRIDRIAGVDFMLEICQIAEETGDSVFLLGSGDDEVVKKTAEKLLKKFPRLKIAGVDKGPKIVECHCEESRHSRDDEAIPSHKCNSVNGGIASPALGGLAMTSDNDNLVNQINKSGATIAFVAFGMGKQEKWIYENLAKMPGVKIAMGVGGAFDYLAGKLKRAPCWMRKIGLEWIYRLFKQPKRFLRIFNATIRFSCRVIKNIKILKY